RRANKGHTKESNLTLRAVVAETEDGIGGVETRGDAAKLIPVDVVAVDADERRRRVTNVAAGEQYVVSAKVRRRWPGCGRRSVGRVIGDDRQQIVFFRGVGRSMRSDQSAGRGYVTQCIGVGCLFLGSGGWIRIDRHIANRGRGATGHESRRAE